MKIKVGKNEPNPARKLFRCLVTRVMYVAASSEDEAALIAHSESPDEAELLPEVDVMPATKEQAKAEGRLSGTPYGNDGGLEVKDFFKPAPKTKRPA